MGTFIFWMIIAFLIIIMVVNNYRNERMQKNERIEYLKEEYGKVIEPNKSERLDHNILNVYYRYISERNKGKEFYIDDITWNDLNLDSVYEVLNRTYTSAGEEILYANLRTLHLTSCDSDSLYKRSEMYNQNENVRIKVLDCLDKQGKISGISSFEIINRLFKAEKININKDIITDVAILVSFFVIFISPALGMLAFLGFLFYSIFTYFNKKTYIDENIRAYRYALGLIDTKIKLNACLNEAEDNNINPIKKNIRYSFLIPKKDGTSSNPFTIIYNYICMIFHVDIIAYSLGISTVIDSKDVVLRAFEQIGKEDVALALASYIRSVSYVCEAEFSIEPKCFDAEKMYHPLTTKSVTNDLTTYRGVLITGSNASGKSTFLKMVGINVIFARSFGFALANKFRLSPFILYTSMALNDNIMGKESYYIVETRSLKRICDIAAEDNVMCIVDEVLRGTNTMERIAASSSILKYLAVNNIICFVATHDNELTQILDESYDMYYFTEIIENDEIVFPYKISKGVSVTGNAIKLLDTMGYDSEIVSLANEMADKYKNVGKWEKV